MGGLERARHIADTNYHRPLRVKDLADAAAMSRFHFLREFRRAYFETPHQYITRKRLERAKELLALTEMSVIEVCFEVGFESPGSFSYLFHRAVGWSPSAYRARCVAQRNNPRGFIPACCWHKFGLGLAPADIAAAESGHGVAGATATAERAPE